MPRDGARRLLVRLPTWVGDCVMVTPALRALRAQFRDDYVIAQARGHLFPLLDGADLYDEKLPLHVGRGRVAAERLRCKPHAQGAHRERKKYPSSRPSRST